MLIRIGCYAAPGDERWDLRFGSVGNSGPFTERDSSITVFAGKLHRSGKAVERWNGAEWQVVGQTDGAVFHLAETKQRLFAAGAFTSISGMAARNIAAWDGTNWNALDAGNATAFGERIGTMTLDRGGSPLVSGMHANDYGTERGSVWKLVNKGWRRLGNEIAVGRKCRVENIVAGFSNVFVLVYYELGDTNHTYGHQILELNSGKWRALDPQPVRYGVHCMAMGPDDNPIIGGEFYTNPSLTNLARWDGKAWENIGGGVKGYPLALAFSGRDLIVSGNFSGAGSVTSRGLVRWTGKKWEGFGSGFSGGGTMYAMTTTGCFPSDMTRIKSIAVDNERVFASGNFTRAGNSGATGLATWDGKEWQSLNSAAHQGVNGAIHSLVVIGTNLFAAGEFTGAGGVAVDGLAHWDGQLWKSLATPVMPGRRGNAATDGTNLFVTGSGANAELFEWDQVDWKRRGLTGTDWARGLAVARNEIFVGGFGVTKSSGAEFARIPNGIWTTTISVDALALGPDATLYVGGSFAGAGGFPGRGNFSHFAIWNRKTWLNADGGIAGYASRVRTIAVRGSDVYVGGNFRKAGRQGVNSLARWDGRQWHDVGEGVTGDGEYDGNYWNVSAITFHGNNMYVGGYFSQAGRVRANNIAKWNGKQWSSLGSGVDGRVNALAVLGGWLYAGGEFSTAGGGPSSNIACWRLD